MGAKSVFSTDKLIRERMFSTRFFAKCALRGVKSAGASVSPRKKKRRFPQGAFGESEFWWRSLLGRPFNAPRFCALSSGSPQKGLGVKLQFCDSSARKVWLTPSYAQCSNGSWRIWRKRKNVCGVYGRNLNFAPHLRLSSQLPAPLNFARIAR